MCLWIRNIKNNPLTIETASGIKTLNLEVVKGNVSAVTLDMGSPILDPKLIPVNLDIEQVINYSLLLTIKKFNYLCING